MAEVWALKRNESAKSTSPWEGIVAVMPWSTLSYDPAMIWIEMGNFSVDDAGCGAALTFLCNTGSCVIAFSANKVVCFRLPMVYVISQGVEGCGLSLSQIVRDI